ncbi:MAG TPA: ATP-binding protein, partial [Herpetosiphonaceae bacterium]|nr:ATP-binding protein [Herpetosiphonaceae bacterium]
PLAAALLDDLAARTQAAVADIRRVVYALRPPALDDLGLVSALREQAAQYQGVHVSVEVPAALPVLPAAVEVAVYRIVQEALTNVARHARARTSCVRLEWDQAAGLLHLEVVDDGRGIDARQRMGVGLHSMRERAVELGGTWSIEALPAGGTRVQAVLPLRRSAAGEVPNHPIGVLSRSEP